MRRLLIAAALALVTPLGLQSQEDSDSLRLATREDLEASIQRGARPGDQIEIRVFTAAGETLPEVTGERVVGPTGRIFLPYVGDIEVAGLSPDDLRRRLARAFSAFYEAPVVDIQLRLRVNVTGAVGAPGNFFVDPSTTLVDLLATAGGTSSTLAVNAGQAASDPSKVRLIRDDRVLVLDMRPDQADSFVLRSPVRSGDWLFVPNAPGSEFRSTLNFISSILGVVLSAVTLIVLVS